MARVHFVKKARKAIPSIGVAVGESYYWWKFRTNGRGGAKRVSKKPPRQSQLTQSEFLSAIYAAEEDLDTAATAFSTDGVVADFASSAEDAANAVREAGEEARSRFDNMPESLQGGETGQLLEGRTDRADELADQLAQLASEAMSLEEPGEGASDEDREDFRDEVLALRDDVDWSVE